MKNISSWPLPPTSKVQSCWQNLLYLKKKKKWYNRLYIFTGEGPRRCGSSSRDTGHSLLGKFDLLVLGGCPLEADRVHCGEKRRHERGRAGPLARGQVLLLGENKGRLSPGEGAGRPRHE